MIKTLDQKPIELAKELLILKETFKTLAEISNASGLSTSKISRHLALLDLPIEIQRMVDAGELPVAQPLNAFKKKEGRNKATRSTVLNEISHEILHILAIKTYATQTQLADYCGKGLGALRHTINDLADMKLISANKEFLPYSYSLTSRGAQIGCLSMPKHFMSANAIHQRLLRNKIEILMRAKNTSASFINRVDCWKSGFFPAIGEHLVSYEYERQIEHALVIIDDYLMSPFRIKHCITRKHDRKKTVSEGSLVLAWEDHVQLVLVYCTDKKHLENHQRFVSVNSDSIPIKTVVRYLSPIWKTI